jgi:translin
MHHIEEVAERIHRSFDARTQARDRVLAQTRILIRHSAHAIRAIHRGEQIKAQENLTAARQLAKTIHAELTEYPDLYYAGYTQDALKEYAEASLVYSLLLQDGRLPDPEELDLEYATYLQGLAEAAGELRRSCLDLLRQSHSERAEKLLKYMDEIYAILITMDYPDAVTGGLRRLTDIVRGVTERTRGDLTISLRQSQLEQSLRRLEERI